MTYDKNTVYEVPVGQIFADDDFNCRGRFNSLEVVELAKSIKADGLHEPIIIQPWLKDNGEEKVIGKKFRVVAGHRRLRATILIQAPTVRSLIRDDLSEADARLLNLTENLSRKDLTILQEAKALEPLRRWNHKDVAARVGRSTGWVASRFQLLDLPSEIQEEIDQGVLPQTLIQDIWSLPNNEQMYEFVRKYKEAKLRGNKKDVTVNKIRQANNATIKRPATREEIFEIQEIIINLFGHGIATRALAWAAGEISLKEMHETLRDEARKIGKFHAIPPQFQLVGGVEYAKAV